MILLAEVGSSAGTKPMQVTVKNKIMMDAYH